MYCRLGFAVKKGQVFSSDQLHPTWKNAPSVNRLKYVHPPIIQSKPRARRHHQFYGVIRALQVDVNMKFSVLEYYITS